MSCEGKHNNSDFKLCPDDDARHQSTEYKFCPECGIQIDEEQVFVNELNKKCKDYTKLLNENGVDNIRIDYIKTFLKKNNIEIICDVYYSDNKFYSFKEMNKMLDFDLYEFKGLIKYDNNIRIYYSYYSNNTLIFEINRYKLMSKIEEIYKKIKLTENYYHRVMIDNMVKIFNTTDEIKEYMKKIIEEL